MVYYQTYLNCICINSNDIIYTYYALHSLFINDIYRKILYEPNVNAYFQ